ncbi:GNAT family N-acetyltransferase [Hwangdonia lutea]|uniref:GNAT family protein n=1 Tax=Hwangdonia lutea TaxID=3075823 RepID=A0AA97HT66_9FLAO|nr:GNAT family protein [Hwangdonia sp. SCSIO 19198]WOD45213.1 GNAT family protein [Hwangdonia sp. SCSIO 19198]
MLFDLESYYIEPIKTEDAWSLCNFIVSNEDRLKRYFPKTLEQNLTPDLSKVFVEKKANQFRLKEEFLFTLKEKNSHQLAGLIYIKEIDAIKKQGEFAYCIGYPFEGKGLTTKSVKVLTRFAFKDLGLKTLQIIVHKDNLASVKIAENCNFIWKKTLKNEFTPNGELPLDMELYELYFENE